jgi:hypothetical protein
MIRREDIDRAVKRLKIIGEHMIADILEEVADELEQAIDDLHGYCHVCIYDKHKVCANCIHTATIFNAGGSADNWEWRGLEDAEKGRSISQNDH